MYLFYFSHSCVYFIIGCSQYKCHQMKFRYSSVRQDLLRLVVGRQSLYRQTNISCSSDSRLHLPYHHLDPYLIS